MVILLMAFNLGAAYGQSLVSHLIGSTGATAQGKSGIITLTASAGEPVVDYYKCNHIYRIGFIQSLSFDMKPVQQNGLNLSPIRTTQVPNQTTGKFQEDERYMLFDAVGRIIRKGVNFRKEDRAFNLQASGIYFLQTSFDGKNVRTEKIMFSK